MKRISFFLIWILSLFLILNSYGYGTPKTIKILDNLDLAPIELDTDNGIIEFYGLPGIKSNKSAFSRIFTYPGGLSNYNTRKEYYKKAIMAIMLEEELNGAKFIEFTDSKLKISNENVDPNTIGQLGQILLKGTDIGTYIFTQLSKDLNLKYIKTTNLSTTFINKMKTALRKVRAGSLTNLGKAIGVVSTLGDVIETTEGVANVVKSLILAKALQADLAKERLQALEKYSSISDKAFRDAISEIKAEIEDIPSKTWQNIYLSLSIKENKIKSIIASGTNIGVDVFSLLGNTISGSWAGTVIFGYKTYLTIKNHIDALRISTLVGTIYKSLPKDVSDAFLEDVSEYSQYLFLQKTIDAFSSTYERFLGAIFPSRKILINTLEESKEEFKREYYNIHIKKVCEDVLNRYGTLIINSNPQGMAIYIDNTDTGYKTPHAFLKIKKGKHRVKIKPTDKYSNMYKEAEEEVAVRPNKIIKINIELNKKIKPGRIIWKYRTGGYITSSPTISGDIIYMGSADNYFYAFNKDTGNLIWKYKTQDNIFFSSNISENIIYVGSYDYYLYALNKDTGELMWKYGTGNNIRSSPTISGNIIYVGSWDGYLYALNKNTGKLIWKYRTGNGISSSSPAISGNTVYVGSGDHYLYAIDKDTGELMWKYRAENYIYSPPTVSENIVYVGSWDGYFYALNKHRGNLIWKYQTGGDIRASSSAFCDNIVYIGSDRGIFYALNKYTGKLIWKYETGGYIRSTPAISGDIVYIPSEDGYLYALNKDTGKLKWKYYRGDMDTNYIDSIPVIKDGILYIGNQKGGELLAISTGDPSSPPWPMFMHDAQHTSHPEW